MVFSGNQLANILSELLIMCHFIVNGKRRNSVVLNVTFYVVIYVLIFEHFLSKLYVRMTVHL